MSDLHGPADYAASYNRTEILVFVSGFSPDLKRSDPGFRVAAVLTASLLECGPHPKAIAELLGYDETWVRTVGGRFRATGIWKGDKVVVKGLDDAADFSYRGWRRAVRAGLGTLEQAGSDQAPGPSRSGECRRPGPGGWSLRLNRFSSEAKRRGRHS